MQQQRTKCQSKQRGTIAREQVEKGCAVVHVIPSIYSIFALQPHRLQERIRAVSLPLLSDKYVAARLFYGSSSWVLVLFWSQSVTLYRNVHTHRHTCMYVLWIMNLISMTVPGHYGLSSHYCLRLKIFIYCLGLMGFAMRWAMRLIAVWLQPCFICYNVMLFYNLCLSIFLLFVSPYYNIYLIVFYFLPWVPIIATWRWRRSTTRKILLLEAFLLGCVYIVAFKCIGNMTHCSSY